MKGEETFRQWLMEDGGLCANTLYWLCSGTAASRADLGQRQSVHPAGHRLGDVRTRCRLFSLFQSCEYHQVGLWPLCLHGLDVGLLHFVALRTRAST